MTRDTPFDAETMVSLVDDAFTRFGRPRHLVVDKAGEFVAGTFRERLDAWGMTLRYCSSDNRRANSWLERLWLTLKRQLGVSRLALPPTTADVHRALRYYAYHRPHQSLGGASRPRLTSAGRQRTSEPSTRHEAVGAIRRCRCHSRSISWTATSASRYSAPPDQRGVRGCYPRRRR